MSKTHPQLVRSNIFLNADRHVLERKIMGTLEAGGGPLGIMMVDLEPKKKEVCGLKEETTLPKHMDMLKKLAIDGVYADDP